MDRARRAEGSAGVDRRTTAMPPATSQLFTCNPVRIKAFRMTLLRRGEIAACACVRVDRPWAHGSPNYTGTALDPRFGKEGVHRNARCATCGNTWRACSAHMGAIVLPPRVALFNPTFDKQIAAVLGAMAPSPGPWAGDGESGHLLAFHTSSQNRAKTLAAVMAAHPRSRLKLLKDHAAPKPRGCGDSKKKSGARWKIDYASGKASVSVYNGDVPDVITLECIDVYELIARLTPRDLEIMGLSESQDGITGILFKDMPVIPTTMRTTGVRDGKASFHAWSHGVNRVAAAAQKLVSATGEARAKHLASAQEAVVAMIDPGVTGKRALSKKPASAHVESMKESIQKKEGLIRANVLGKRGNENGRSTISPDSFLMHGQVGVPDEICAKLCVPEPLNSWSRAHGATASGKWPIRMLTETHMVKLVDQDDDQPDGSTLMVPLRKGHYVLFGRQPTMSNKSLWGMEVVPMPGRTIRFHPDQCPPMNADFDGDEMNINAFGSAESASEIRNLASVRVGLLAEAYSAPAFGVHQDSLFGIMLLTMPGTQLSRVDARRLAGAASWPAGISWRSGADAMSAALVPLGPDFAWSGHGVRVSGGRMFGGPIKKEHVGSSAGSLLHCILHMCEGKAVRFLGTISRLANEFLRMRPPGMTGEDLRLHGDPGRGAPPLAHPVTDAVISAAMSARYLQRVSDPIKRGASNVFTLMTLNGVKGNETNLNQMYGGLGHQTVDGKPPRVVSCGRSLPRLRPNDDSALSKGLAMSSLVDGITPIENVMNALSARVGLVIGRLEVSDSGYKQRRIAQRMKDCVIASDGTVRCGSRIVQYAYGGDGGNPKSDTRLGVSPEAIAEARATGDRDLAMAADALEPLGASATSVVPIDWIIACSKRSPPGEKRSANAVVADSMMVKRAALAMGPWESSTVTRAALLIKLRPSERERTGMTGQALRAMLETAVEHWRRNRAPDGFAAGLFVATSVGPPATQGRLNAFYTSGMHGGGAESADEAAQALENILSASDPLAKKTMRMVLFPKVATREGAQSLASEVVGVRLDRIAAVDCAADARSSALWAAYAVAYPKILHMEHVVVRPRVPAMQAAGMTQFGLGEAIASVTGCETFVWPFIADPCILVAVAGSARPKIAKMLSSAIAVSKAWVPGRDDGAHVVHTVGTDLCSALGMDSVDSRRSYSTSVVDSMRVLGVEAAVCAAEREILRIVGKGKVNRRHLSLFADFMMRTGAPLAFSRHGMRSAGDGPLSRALFETPVLTLAEAALRGDSDDLSSLLTQIFCGSLLRTGTGGSDVMFDTQAGYRNAQGQ